MIINVLLRRNIEKNANIADGLHVLERKFQLLQNSGTGTKLFRPKYMRKLNALKKFIH
jgi:hypothetical protein